MTLIGSPKPSITWDDPQEIIDKYAELIFAVARAFPGETRHQTALRYIMEAESRNNECVAMEIVDTEITTV